MTGVRLVIAQPPPARVPQQVTAETPTDGVRLILVQPPPAPPLYDIRGWGDPYVDGDGVLRVRVVTESAWYRLRDDRGQPRGDESRAYAVDQLWLE